MDLIAQEWNVVVLGRWNPAIFSPFFVAKEIFENSDPVQIETLIPLDSREPIYRYEGFEVKPTSGSLVIAPIKASRACMETCRERMIRTLEMLDRTPISACGFNLRFGNSDDFEGLDSSFRTAAVRRVDAAAGLEPKIWQIKMSYPRDDGFSNFELQRTAEKSLFGFNFHLNTTETAKAIAWLKQDIDECLDFAKNCVHASYQQEVNFVDEQ